MSNLSSSVEIWPYVDPPTISPFEFEKFDAVKWRDWMATNWPFSVALSSVYLLLINVGQRWMRDREPFEIRGFLTAWNLGLAFFSCCGFVRTFPELFQVVSGPDGLHRSICVRDTLNPSSIFWAFLYTWSKVVELGDTIFLVLRKKKLIFLHWFHHVSVLILSFATYADYEPSLRWFGIVNFLVHFYMYTYFTLKAMRFRLPKSVSITVTMFQLSQMVMGIAVNCYAIWMKRQGTPCTRSNTSLKLHLTMYASYLILFVDYFFKTYLVKTPKPKRV